MQAQANATSPWGSTWYVMLFPSREATQALITACQELATATGGVPNPTPHVTVGYFQGVVAPEAVTARVGRLSEPAIPLRASGLFSWSERAHPVFGYTLSLHVQRNRPILAWQWAVRSTLQAVGLTPTFTWAQQQPHVQVLQHLAMPPHEALSKIGDRDVSLVFMGCRLLVSQQIEDRFVTWLDQPLTESLSADTA